VVTIVTDPVYLTEPFIRSTDYELDLHQNVPPYPFWDVLEEVDRAKGVVPHVLPGKKPGSTNSRSAITCRLAVIPEARRLAQAQRIISRSSIAPVN
jgi:hypothetical protein